MTTVPEQYLHTMRALRELTVRDRGRPPSLRELCADADISSTSVANYRLRWLYNKGLVESLAPDKQWIKQAQFRSLVVSDAGLRALGEPVNGR